MAIRNVNWARAEEMTEQQRSDLNISETSGLVAIETHNTAYKQVGKSIKKDKGGILGYIWGLSE